MIVSTAGASVTRSYVASATPQKTFLTSSNDASPATATAATATSGTGALSPTQSTTLDPNGTAPSNNLSKSEIAAIVLYPIAGIIVLAIFLRRLWQRRKNVIRARNAVARVEGKHEPHSDPISEVESGPYVPELIGSGALLGS